MSHSTIPVSSDALESQVRQFDGLWKGGYFEGDPLDRMGQSSYQSLGYLSSLHATYLCCIRPHVGPATVALEIGCGRGAWSKAILGRNPRELWCLDVLSREHNGFDEYVGSTDVVRYIQVADFLCSELPDGHFDFLFSFGCFCHLSSDAIEAYCRNVWPKLRPGAHAFVLVADYEKYNNAVADRALLVDRAVLMTPRSAPRRLWNRMATAALRKKFPRADWQVLRKDEAPDPSPGRFYHAGTSETAAMLRGLGYEVLDEDVGTVVRDPILHFRRP